MLAKSVQKHAGRAKEKILQNLGKVDRTADDIFDEHLNNFNRQQGNANRLQKEFNNYIRCIRAAQTASKSLMEAIAEVYEPQWTGYDALQAQAASSESLWQDFAHKLGDQVLIPLNTYTGQFPEMKKKIEKRNRKLIDYDGQRHSFQNLQANANKRKDDVKLTKGREQLEDARRTYEILNTELHDELPALYDSRILFLVTNLQTLFATEQVFHNETAKIYSELEAIVDKLATDSQRGSNTLRKQTTNAIKSASPVQSPIKQMNNVNNSNNYENQITNGSSNINSPPSTSSSAAAAETASRPSEAAKASGDSLTQNVKAMITPDSVSGAAAAAVVTPPHRPTPPATPTTPPPTTPSPPPTPSPSPVASDSATATVTATNEPSYQKAASILASIAESAPPKPAKISESAAEDEAEERNANTETERGGHVDDKATVEAAAVVTSVTIDEVGKLNGNGNADVNQNKSDASTTTTTTTTSPPAIAAGADATPTKPTTPQAAIIETNSSASTAAAVSSTSTPKAGGSPAPPSTNNGNLEDNKKEAIGKVIVDETQKQPSQYQQQQKQQQQNNIPHPPKKSHHEKIASRKVESNNNNKNPFEESDERIYEVPNEATTTDLPPGVLYRVKATYGYVKEDVDELSFEIGDIIRVIEYDDPEDQEEGWLMGQKEGSSEKGLFPANFTRPI